MFNLTSQPEIKNYIRTILDSNIHSNDKVTKIKYIIDMCESFEAELQKNKEGILAGTNEQSTVIVNEIAKKLDIWKPVQFTDRIKDSINAAVGRLLSSQSPSHLEIHGGGWGSMFQQSKYWDTAWALLSLQFAMTLDFIKIEKSKIENAISNGIHYFIKNNNGWACGDLSFDQGFSNYDMPLVLRTIYELHKNGNKEIKQDLLDKVEMTVDLVVSKQNSDGGWDARIWPEWKYRSQEVKVQVYSDVSPTSQIMQMLCCIGPDKYRNAIDKAINWVKAYQNDNGSWSMGSTSPDKKGIYCLQDEALVPGIPTISKTCDGLQAIFAWKDVETKNTKHEINIPVITEIDTAVEKAVKWLQLQEKPIFEPNKIITKWSDYDYTNTCITLEALVKHPDDSLPLRTSNALWLIENQIRKVNDIDDGKWQGEQTPRIAHCLIKFYNQILKSPLFK